MDQELKNILILQLKTLDEIRKNTEILAKSLGNKVFKPKPNLNIEALTNGLQTYKIIDGEINEQKVP